LRAAKGTVLSIRQLSRSFREGDRVHQVLVGAAATVGSGEIVAITGRSGSGKSTLLNLVSGIDAPDGGSVELDGTEVSALPEPARTRFRRAHVGFIYQFFNLIPTLDVEENVRLVLELNGVRGREAQARSRRVLGEVGLAERAHSAVDQLSGGEQQRVAIAAAAARQAPLLLADEPTAELDEENERIVLEALRRLRDRHDCAVVIVTHAPPVAESADRVIEIRDGRVA